MRTSHKNALLLIAACAVSTGASAHTGHRTESFMEGLAHPFGLDHLLAMVAVGVWSVSALPAHKAWQGPATFLLALVLSALLGASGVTLPYLEHAIALSVSLFGLMLVMAAKPVPKTFGLGLIAAAAGLHGLAHGAETPATGFAGYAAGFLLITAVLHVGGVGLGMGIRRWLAGRSGTVLTTLGSTLGVAGAYLFIHV
ncbi:MAG: urease accessory protein UreJ [Curvibacter sp. RIFCSPHIGHO2_12_FULL_63_18]|uniref:HupE/UreJ family protein n=1 Tax=Rhodoferax sp. TaxID=50421 RepID=UPI0008C132FA|nr:HupE/UreJ family protein [Rhodoferax sp.]OGO96069.1 MAG: urease accessory protein UreJ [Curvibacter sp. GWA2_63_95]OGP04759.1 MAG: urease accessory protein UreJ [Curvibacter sp. RIFCSPHIGHO2_12_FULL_63_18]HCX81839.1 urease accessory protein UreJ [Rhodoferax sp.]